MHLHFPKSPSTIIDNALSAIVYVIMLALAVGATVALATLLVDLVWSVF